ncbi:HD-GYP domain-containing protein [Colwellia maritima]|uniref:HD-GYP domain-containing protein n=1 Tax=Colwellia maritima TaxID=2912588 RepID=UPI0030843C9B
MIVEKQLTELHVGHYVTEIAKQLDSFSLSAPGYIKNNKVIAHLKNKNVLSVFIDDSKTIRQPHKAKADAKVKAKIKTKTKEEISAEIKQAKEIFNESKDIQKNLFSQALSGANIDLKPVIDVTRKSVDAILNNPDSLVCMVNIREKDAYLLEHSVAVSVYITIFAYYLKMRDSVIHNLSIGAFLHDIGKIKVPDEILNKPSKLTDDEFTIMKTHVNHSIELIKEIPGLSKLSLDVAALHHEKLNGEGYPFQIEGKDIHIYGRMIAICDIYDALTAARCYKEGFPPLKLFRFYENLVKVIISISS